MWILHRIKAWLEAIDHRQQQDDFTIVRSEEEHLCPYCSERFVGRYCPQCGKRPELERTTLKRAVVDFFEMWNLSNNTLFRTLHGLLWRPGYLINDWLNGRRQIYFSPILSLLTVCLFFALVMKVRGLSFQPTSLVQVSAVDSLNQAKNIDSLLTMEINDLERELKWTESAPNDSVGKRLGEAVAMRGLLSANDMYQRYERWMDNNIAYKQMIFNVLVIVALFFMFRKSPRRPRTSLLEMFFAQLYVDTGMWLVASFWVLLTGWLSTQYVFYPMPDVLAFLLLIIVYRQLFGHTLWGTAWRLAVVVMLVRLFLIIAFGLYVMGYAFGTGVASTANG